MAEKLDVVVTRDGTMEYVDPSTGMPLSWLEELPDPEEADWPLDDEANPF